MKDKACEFWTCSTRKWTHFSNSSGVLLRQLQETQAVIPRKRSMTVHGFVVVIVIVITHSSSVDENSDGCLELALSPDAAKYDSHWLREAL